MPQSYDSERCALLPHQHHLWAVVAISPRFLAEQVSLEGPTDTVLDTLGYRWPSVLAHHRSKHVEQKLVLQNREILSSLSTPACFNLDKHNTSVQSLPLSNSPNSRFSLNISIKLPNQYKRRKCSRSTVTHCCAIKRISLSLQRVYGFPCFY